MLLVTPPLVTRSPSSTTRSSTTIAPALRRSSRAPWCVVARLSFTNPAWAKSIVPVQTPAMQTRRDPGLGQQRQPGPALHLRPGAHAGACDPTASGHDKHVGAGGTDGVGQEPQPACSVHDVLALPCHELGRQVRSPRGHAAEHFEGPERIQLVDAVVDDDVESHRTMVAETRGLVENPTTPSTGNGSSSFGRESSFRVSPLRCHGSTRHAPGGGGHGDDRPGCTRETVDTVPLVVISYRRRSGEIE